MLIVYLFVLLLENNQNRQELIIDVYKDQQLCQELEKLAKQKVSTSDGRKIKEAICIKKEVSQ